MVLKSLKTDDLRMRYMQMVTSYQSADPGTKSTHKVSYFQHHSMAETVEKAVLGMKDFPVLWLVG